MRLFIIFIASALTIKAYAQQKDTLSNAYYGLTGSYIYDLPSATYTKENIASNNGSGFRLGVQALFNGRGKMNYLPRVSYIHSYAGVVYSEYLLWNYFPSGMELAMGFRYKVSEQFYSGLEVFDRISANSYHDLEGFHRNSMLGMAISFGWFKGKRILLNPELSYGLGYLFNALPGTEQVWMHSISLSFSVLGAPKHKEKS